MQARASIEEEAVALVTILEVLRCCGLLPAHHVPHQLLSNVVNFEESNLRDMEPGSHSQRAFSYGEIR